MNITPEIYGIAADGSYLQWYRYTPITVGPWPVVLTIHGGGFHGGGPPSTAIAAQDLCNAGYLTFAISYRLAPPGKIMNQPRTFGGRITGIASGPGSDATIHDQMDDVRMAVIAARGQTDCNGEVFAVGGSAGATHAAFAAMSGTSEVDKLDGAVCLSGAYQLENFNDSYFTPAKGRSGLAYRTDVCNYCQIPNTNPSTTLSLQQASPIYADVTDCSPIFFVSSVQDPMPTNQYFDLITALAGVGKSPLVWPGTGLYQCVMIPGDLHEFAYWYSPIAQGSTTVVKDAVVNYLNSLP